MYGWSEHFKFVSVKANTTYDCNLRNDLLFINTTLKNINDIKSNYQSCHLKIYLEGNNTIERKNFNKLGGENIKSTEVYFEDTDSIKSKFVRLLCTCNLTKLSARGNMIHKLKNDSFGECVNLTHVNLAANRIQNIHSEALKGLTNLNELNFQQNYISHFKNGTFDHLINLKILDLSYNLISTLSVNLFKGLNKLKINFKYNEIDDNLSEEWNSYRWENKNLNESYYVCNTLVEIYENKTEKLRNEYSLMIKTLNEEINTLQAREVDKGPKKDHIEMAQIYIYSTLGLVMIISLTINLCMCKKFHAIKNLLGLYTGQTLRDYSEVKNSNKKSTPIYAESQKKRITCQEVQSIMPEYATVNKPNKTPIEMYAVVNKSKKSSITEPKVEIYATVNKPSGKNTTISSNINKKPELIYAELNLKESINFLNSDKTIYDTIAFSSKPK